MALMIAAGAWEPGELFFLVLLAALLLTGIVHIAVIASRARGPVRALRDTWRLMLAYAVPASGGAGVVMGGSLWWMMRGVNTGSPFPEVFVSPAGC